MDVANETEPSPCDCYCTVVSDGPSTATYMGVLEERLRENDGWKGGVFSSFHHFTYTPTNYPIASVYACRLEERTGVCTHMHSIVLVCKKKQEQSIQTRKQKQKQSRDWSSGWKLKLNGCDN